MTPTSSSNIEKSDELVDGKRRDTEQWYNQDLRSITALRCCWTLSMTVLCLSIHERVTTVSNYIEPSSSLPFVLPLVSSLLDPLRCCCCCCCCCVFFPLLRSQRISSYVACLVI
ncbi:hypothetical protein BDZ90DRAFT_170548 [Jaminaea rosea]|uniref:Uncharacterized protein n=1 Tax=Jaminaea rosea TaxID=1569628 RepID=A0A316UQZ8_9BASI|nr:hypothetical protein BDZ90DRAFT_170548 [Jaminaea rosea]PWN27729.1 hypothetical protein BDZ90DRAFT_170548 [Jaminaea rosea]